MRFALLLALCLAAGAGVARAQEEEVFDAPEEAVLEEAEPQVKEREPSAHIVVDKARAPTRRRRIRCNRPTLFSLTHPPLAPHREHVSPAPDTRAPPAHARSGSGPTCWWRIASSP